MSRMKMERDLNILSEKFKTGNYNLQTVSEIISCIRYHLYVLEQEEIKKLLEIAKNVLLHDVELKNPNSWVEARASYFTGNIVNLKSPCYKDLISRFSQSNFTLGDVIYLIDCIQKGKYECDDFILRIPEITIKEDVKLLPGNFMESGKIFAKYIDSIIFNKEPMCSFFYKKIFKKRRVFKFYFE